MQATRMINFHPFRSFFKHREQHIARLANAGRFDKLIKMGVEPELLEWHAMRHRGLAEAVSLTESVIQGAMAEPLQDLGPSRMAS